jgi:hypothetical protein
VGVFDIDPFVAPKRVVPAEFLNKLFVKVNFVLLNKLALDSIFTLEPNRLPGFGSLFKIKIGLSVF